MERAAISTLEPFGVPGLIYAGQNRTKRSGKAGVDFYAWAVYDRIQQPPAPFGEGILHAAAEALLQMTAAIDHLVLFSRCEAAKTSPAIRAPNGAVELPCLRAARQPQRRAIHRRALPGTRCAAAKIAPAGASVNLSILIETIQIYHDPRGATVRHGRKQKTRAPGHFFA